MRVKKTYCLLRYIFEGYIIWRKLNSGVSFKFLFFSSIRFGIVPSISSSVKLQNLLPENRLITISFFRESSRELFFEFFPGVFWPSGPFYFNSYLGILDAISENLCSLSACLWTGCGIKISFYLNWAIIFIFRWPIDKSAFWLLVFQMASKSKVNNL